MSAIRATTPADLRRDRAETARVALAMINNGFADYADAILADARKRGCVVAEARLLLEQGREAAAREVLEGWADE